MATLLNGVTTDTVGTGASHSSEATVFVRGDLGGGRVVIQVADENVAASFVKGDNVSVPNPCTFSAPGVVNISCKGTYFIRAILEGTTSTPNVTVETTS